jgi:hypothetical protein
MQVCNFTYFNCAAVVHVALGRQSCPQPSPRWRVGLDGGTQPGWADVAHDGRARDPWGVACAQATVDEARDCHTVVVPQGGSAELTLWFRVLSGTAVLQLQGPRVAGEQSGVRVTLATPSHGSLLLSGAVPQLPSDAPGDKIAAALEPPAASVTLHHACAADGEGAKATYGVGATLVLRDFVPVELGWRVSCE